MQHPKWMRVILAYCVHAPKLSNYLVFKELTCTCTKFITVYARTTNQWTSYPTHDGSHLQLYSYTGKNDDTPVDQFSLQVRPAAHTSVITAVTQSWFQIKLRGEKERRKKIGNLLIAT